MAAWKKADSSKNIWAGTGAVFLLIYSHHFPGYCTKKNWYCLVFISLYQCQGEENEMNQRDLLS